MALDYAPLADYDKDDVILEYASKNISLVEEANSQLQDLLKDLTYDLINTYNAEGTRSKYLTAPLSNSFLLFNSLDPSNSHSELFNLINIIYWTIIAKAEITGYSKKQPDFVRDLVHRASVHYQIHSYLNLNPLLAYPELTAAQFAELEQQLAANPTSVKELKLGFYNWQVNNKNKETIAYADSLLDHAVLLYLAQHGANDPHVLEVGYQYLSRYGVLAGIVGAFAQIHRTLRRKIGYQITADLLAIDEVNDYSLLTDNFTYVVNEYVSHRTNQLDNFLAAARTWQDDTSGKPFHQVVGQGDDLDPIFNNLEYHGNLAVYESELNAGGYVQDQKALKVLFELQRNLQPLHKYQEAAARAKEFYSQTLFKNKYTPESWCNIRIKNTPKTYTENLGNIIADTNQEAVSEGEELSKQKTFILISILIIVGIVGYFIGDKFL